jgi:hypothetical protein
MKLLYFKAPVRTGQWVGTSHRQSPPSKRTVTPLCQKGLNILDNQTLSSAKSRRKLFRSESE